MDVRIVCISDTHEMHRSLAIPTADLLLHAGDITMMGHPERIIEFNEWCEELLQRKTVTRIIGIAGNHDFLFERNPSYARSLIPSVTYLKDSLVQVMGLNIYGTPWQPWFYDWAFNIRTEEELHSKFALIPEGTDILICHSPPRGILDANHYGQPCGSTALLDAIQRVKPKLVVFGHIHESYGTLEKDGILYVNASNCSLDYRSLNKPVYLALNFP